MHRLAFVVLTLIVAGFSLQSPVNAAEPDKVQQLEQRMVDLEKQILELKTMLQEEREKNAAHQATGVAVPAGQATAPAAAGAGSVETKKPVTQLIGPGGTLGIGGDIRFRPEFFDNVWDFDDNIDTDRREAVRFRPRVYLDWKPTDDVEAYVRFAKEYFYGQDKEFPGFDVESKDVMIDNAWGDWKNMFNSNFSLRVGRQDLIYGDGFVLLDGTPNDGSQTTSFDAVKMMVSHDLGTTDLIFAKLQEFQGWDSDDETLYAIYNKFNLMGINVEPYIMYRDKNANPAVVSVPGVGFNNSAQFDPSPAEETLLLGFRSTKDFYVADGVKLALAAELGKEWGKVDFAGMDAQPANLQFSRQAGSGEVDRDAWGGQTSATITFEEVTWKPSVKAAFSYMSGDDPGTEDYEGWDDFYGEWPKYSELYVYSLYDGFKRGIGANDPDIGLWANMYIPELSLTVSPIDKLTQNFRYLYFLAEEKTGPGGDNDRGHNIQSLTNYVFTPNLSGHLLLEYFFPGDFYLDADDAYYGRIQLMYTF